MCVSSSENARASSSPAKYPSARPQAVTVSTTRLMSCRTVRSRWGVPRVPRKYFEVTTLVAICDQALGTSTLFCSNTIFPFSFWMVAERISHSTWS